MKGVSIFLADGFEDVEALAVCDVLRRGGVDVRLVSVTGSETVVSSHGVKVVADCLFEPSDCGRQPADASDFMIFPGGMPGSRTLASCEPLISEMRAHYDEGGSVAAICAAPGLVLGQLDAISGHRFTCFDGFETLPVSKGARFEKSPAVADGRIITGRSAGHAISFGLEILKSVCGEEKMEEVRQAMMLSNS